MVAGLAARGPGRRRRDAGRGAGRAPRRRPAAGPPHPRAGATGGHGAADGDRSGVRPGRKVQVVDTVVTQGGTEVAWGRAVRIRVDPTGVAARAHRARGPGARAAVGRARRPVRDQRLHGVPQRRGGHPVRPRAGSTVPDRPPPGSGCGSRWWPARSRPRPSGRWRCPTSATASAPSSTSARTLFINPDLTVYLHRPPGGGVGLPRRPDPVRAAGHRHGRVGPVGRQGSDRSGAPEPLRRGGPVTLRRLPGGDAVRRRPAPGPGRRRPPGDRRGRPGAGPGPRPWPPVPPGRHCCRSTGGARAAARRGAARQRAGVPVLARRGGADRLRWWSGSTRPGGARHWRATSAAPTAGCW